jgi:hypothetical protein
MSETLYLWYENSCQQLARYNLEKQNSSAEHIEETEEVIKGWEEVINMVNNQFPYMKERYMREKDIQKTFTSVQINFICEKIGDWYLMMKPLLEGTHNLGYMKEKLKIMICGDE